MQETNIQKEKVIIAYVNTYTNDELFSYHFNEVINLAEACDFEVAETLIQNLEHPKAKTYLGSGKLDELRMMKDALEVDTIIFADELSPSQIANLQKYLNVEVIDRNMLILTIFEKRAKTKEAVLQVKIAKLKYMLPRLIGSRDYMSRTGGGASGAVGARRGSGETKLELDQRHIEKQIYKAQSELKDVVKNRQEARKSRKANDVKVVAFVGYTNVGKSTTINNLIEMFNSESLEEKAVFVKNMLFATLETTTRRIKTNNNHEFLITDTVGFVSNLPHHLIESFKSTLEEILDADLVVHVIDASSPYLDLQVSTTIEVLNELGIKDIPILNVYNKIDLINDFVLQSLNTKDNLFISGKTKNGYNELIDKIESILYPNQHKIELLIPYDKGEILNKIITHSIVNKTEYLDSGIYIDAVVSEYLYNLYKQYEIKK